MSQKRFEIIGRSKSQFLTICSFQILCYIDINFCLEMQYVVISKKNAVNNVLQSYDITFNEW